MFKSIILKSTLAILLATSSAFAEFVPKANSEWSYQFESYTDAGGIILPRDGSEPDYPVSQAEIDTMFYALPEHIDAQVAHPEYFPEPEPEIIVTKEAEVFVTFYAESAAFKDALGYYTYDGNTSRVRPTKDTLSNIQADGTILFANTSLLNSGGDLATGTTVSLGRLSVGTKVMFYIVTKGWQNAQLGVTTFKDSIFSSLSDLNPYLEGENNKHVALFRNTVGGQGILLMGWENLNKTDANCDNDFNDLIFAISASPMSALTDTVTVGITDGTIAPETATFADLTVATDPADLDSDGDGINDAFDSYPDDFERAYDQSYPNDIDSVTLLFEDNWPREADYDMNDLSVSLAIKEVKDANDSVKEIIFTGRVNSYGANYTNGFSLDLNTTPDNILDANITVVTADGNVTSSLTPHNPNSNRTTLDFFDDANISLTRWDNSDEINADINPYIAGKLFTVRVVLKNATKLASPPYNPFIKVSQYQTVGDNPLFGVEIHLPNYMPSEDVNVSHFGEKDDDSDLSIGYTYRTKYEAKPWAIMIPTSFAHPTTGTPINDAYHHFDEWVNSNGAEYSDWYIHTNIGYSNPDLIVDSTIK